MCYIYCLHDLQRVRDPNHLVQLVEDRIFLPWTIFAAVTVVEGGIKQHQSGAGRNEDRELDRGLTPLAVAVGENFGDNLGDADVDQGTARKRVQIGRVHVDEIFLGEGVKEPAGDRAEWGGSGAQSDEEVQFPALGLLLVLQNRHSDDETFDPFVESDDDHECEALGPRTLETVRRDIPLGEAVDGEREQQKDGGHERCVLRDAVRVAATLVMVVPVVRSKIDLSETRRDPSE